MIIEQNTNYAYKLKYMDNPTFEKVRDLAIRFLRELPKQLQDELYEALNRGVDILDSEPQMVAYLHAFGQMHQAKLEYAFQKLDQDKFFYYHEINIIDYGCGQALGTMCYANFLSQNNYEQQVKRIILIEPSEICLKRAALHASVFFPDAEIKTINKKFDDLTQDDIVCSEEIPTLHIFSNVLDMLCFELDKFSNLIKSCLKGYNQFVCVGPYFNYSDKDDRVDGFCSIINGNNYYNKKFNKYEFYEDKAWAAQINCFSIGEIEERRLFLDETVTHEDIENGIIDEYGIVYSKDGKRLLACNNYNLETYSIKTGTKMICAFAFGDIETLSRTSLKHIIIPNTVIIIGDGAFEECKSLQNITIPDSVKFIGHSAFKRCSALQKIIIPNSVTSIQSGAFEWCTSLRQVILHNSIKFIGDRAFDPWFLEQIEIPKGTTEKFMKLLDDNYWGKFVELSDSQSSVLIHPHEEIEKHLTEVSEDIINNGIIDDPVSCRWLAIVYSKSGKRLLKCKNPYLETYSIKQGTKIICDNAFEGISNLRTICIPDSVTTIGDNSFCQCESLQQISLPNSIMKIGYNAFLGCNSLQQIKIPKGSDGKFKRILEEGLWDKLFESSINSESLSTEVAEEDAVEDEYGVMYSMNGDSLLKCKNKSIESYNVRQGTRIICDSAFLEISTLKQIVIPDSVTDIEDQAFLGCKSLQKIDIPNSITSIGYNAFGLCESLQSINIPDSVTFLGPATFHKCISLQQVSIPNSLVRINYMTFCECNSIQQIVIPNSITVISDWAFSECKSLKQITISDSLSHLGTGVFAKCESLEQFVLPNSVQSIGDSAFEECKSLQQIIIPKGSTEKFRKMLNEELWDRLIEK